MKRAYIILVFLIPLLINNGCAEQKREEVISVEDLKDNPPNGYRYQDLRYKAPAYFGEPEERDNHGDGSSVFFYPNSSVVMISHTGIYLNYENKENQEEFAKGAFGDDYKIEEIKVK